MGLKTLSAHLALRAGNTQRAYRLLAALDPARVHAHWSEVALEVYLLRSYVANQLGITEDAERDLAAVEALLERHARWLTPTRERFEAMM
ncbi:MAG: hypothetical protein ACI835_001007 [Planctomycetota bacterium]|jgi:hypothetical protein